MPAELASPPESEIPDHRFETASPILSRENFTAQADDIIATMADSARKREPRITGYKRATEAYVTEEENPDLKQFGEMLLGANDAEKTQKNLDVLYPKVKAKRASPEEVKEYYDLRAAAISYNHQVRDVIWEHPNVITRADMNRWLEMCGSGDSDWADRLLQGVASEVAVAREIQKLRGVSEVRMSTIKEDGKGTDFIAVLTDGREVCIDVKSGEQSLGIVQKREGIEVGVEKDMFQNFSVKPEYGDFIQAGFAREAGLQGLTDLAA